MGKKRGPHQGRGKPCIIKLFKATGQDDSKLQIRSCFYEVLLCIQTGKRMSDEDRMRFDTEELYIKSPKEMSDFFENVPEAIEMLKDIIGKVPLFGICLGHQLFALASGANTSKLKFGHRGLNHPVKNLATGKVAITSQNHGYAVEEESVENTELEITHVALNDGTVEGLRHKKFPAFTVQYHPEASAGPEDANDLFEDFLTMIENFKKEGEELCQNA